VTATGDLFELMPIGPIETPAARNTDPHTSHEAAEAITASGEREQQQKRVALAVRLWPGRTSAEIAALMNEHRQMPARRLPELETAGWVTRGKARKCTYSNRNAITWWPKPECFAIGKPPITDPITEE
jgi:hypothetical protein